MPSVATPPEDIIHIARSLRSNSSDGQHVSTGMDVYVPRFKAMVRVPHSNLCHIPTSRSDPSRPPKVLVLCNDFDKHRVCPRGDNCWYAHALVDGLPLLSTHVNFAWRTVQDVVFPRMQPGKRLHVAAPNSRRSVEIISSDMVLLTQALNSSHRLTHCAHYYFNRSCRLGVRCGFVHAICIDPDAKDHHIAPGPLFDSSRSDCTDPPSPKNMKIKRTGTSTSPLRCDAANDSSRSTGENSVHCNTSPLPPLGRARQHNPYAAVPLYVAARD
jgi:hypothetical protein